MRSDELLLHLEVALDKGLDDLVDAGAASFPNCGSYCIHLPDASLAPVLTGLLSLTAMLLLRRRAPRLPAALLVAGVATILVGLFDGEAAGVRAVGDLPSGLPRLALPDLDPAKLRDLVPGALAIVLVGYAEALGGAKPRQCKVAATSIRTRSSSHTGPPIF